MKASHRSGESNDGLAKKDFAPLRLCAKFSSTVNQFIAVGTPPDEDGSADLHYAGSGRDHREAHARIQGRHR